MKGFWLPRSPGSPAPAPPRSPILTPTPTPPSVALHPAAQHRARVPDARSCQSETHLVTDLTSMCVPSPPAGEVAKRRPRPAVGGQAQESILGSAY